MFKNNLLPIALQLHLSGQENCKPSIELKNKTISLKGKKLLLLFLSVLNSKTGQFKRYTFLYSIKNFNKKVSFTFKFTYKERILKIKQYFQLNKQENHIKYLKDLKPFFSVWLRNRLISGG